MHPSLEMQNGNDNPPTQVGLSGANYIVNNIITHMHTRRPILVLVID